MRALSLVVVASCASLLVASPARADKTDSCIAAAERGQQLRRAMSLRAARDVLLSCAREACPSVISSDCKRWLAEVDAAMPSVVFRATDANGHDLVDVTVTVDGTVTTKRLDGHPLPIDPGEHALRFDGPASLPVTSRIVVREGERDRLIGVELVARGAPPAAAKDPAATTRTHAEPAPRDSSPVPAGAWILGGLGIVAMGAGAGLWISGRSERADLFATCGDTRACSSADESSAKTKLLAGDVAFVAGVVAVGAAVWWALASRQDPPPAVARLSARPTGGGIIAGYWAPF